MAAKMSPIRIQQSLQGDIAKLRRQNIFLRGALADIVSMTDIGEAKAHALKTLTHEPAVRDSVPVGHGDVGSAG
jgi:hypothetical protein